MREAESEPEAVATGSGRIKTSRRNKCSSVRGDPVATASGSDTAGRDNLSAPHGYEGKSRGYSFIPGIAEMLETLSECPF
jgi:hypothetical protein